MHDLLALIGIEAIPPGQTEEALVKRALQDNFLYNKVLAYLVEEHAIGVVGWMPKLEREALRNRLVPPQRGATKNPARWTMHEAVSNGQPYLQVLCLACNQDLKFPGPPPRDHKGRIGVSRADVSRALDGVAFAHCGHIEKPPADFREHAEYIFQRIVNVEE